MDSKTFISKLSNVIALDNAQTLDLVAALASVMRDRYAASDTIAIPGFGNFIPVKHDETIQIDLATGRRMLLPPQITLEFFPASSFKNFIAHE